MLLNVNDPIQVHLLVETALEDSKKYELLSQEEVDDLKGQIKNIEQRIDQTRQNLAIQSKYRDAAVSMGKLYMSGRGQNGDARSRRSQLGLRNGHSEELERADQEREASERKCQDLALELWHLEKRLMDVQRRLLQHTAGILQMTHRGPSIGTKGSGGIIQGQMPGSPQSMFTYSNARSSVGAISEAGDLFDERSLYRTFERLDGLGSGRPESIGGSRSRSPAHLEQLDIINKTEQRLQDLNKRLRDMLTRTTLDQNFDKIPKAALSTASSVPGKLIPDHLDYLEHGIVAIDGHFQAIQGSDYRPALTGLWEEIQAREEQVRKTKQQDKLARSASGVQDVDDDLSDDEPVSTSPESFHIEAFTTKMRSLFSQALALKEQKKVLQRQIKQQRELNNKDTGALQDQLKAAENESRDLQSQLQTAMQQLDKSRRESTQRGLEKAKRDNEESAAIAALEQKLAASNDAIAQFEEELQELKDERSISDAEMQSRLTDAQTKVNSLMEQLKEAETASASLAEKEKEIEERDMRIAELTTEVTIARAELDGAYGTRAQRAAEVAANPAIQKEIDDLTNRNREMTTELDDLRAKAANSDRVAQLQKELSETIEEYEVMTKASIEWEKERETLEAQIDKLRDEREALESKLSDEQVKWLGIKSPGGPSSDANANATGAGSTSTAVLKNEFKKMMRDTRAENAKALRVSFSDSSCIIANFHRRNKLREGS